jgi:hypothetical protein
MALAQQREGGKDRVNRFCDAEGKICVSIIGQDSYFLTGMGQDTKWDFSATIDHDKILKVLQDEIARPGVFMVIFEGFKAFHDERILQHLDVLFWIQVPKELSCQRRMKNKHCTQLCFDTTIWPFHVAYEKRVSLLEKSGKCKRYFLDGATTKKEVLEEALLTLTPCVLFRHTFGARIQTGGGPPPGGGYGGAGGSLAPPGGGYGGAGGSLDPPASGGSGSGSGDPEASDRKGGQICPPGFDRAWKGGSRWTPVPPLDPTNPMQHPRARSVDGRGRPKRRERPMVPVSRNTLEEFGKKIENGACRKTVPTILDPRQNAMSSTSTGHIHHPRIFLREAPTR